MRDMHDFTWHMVNYKQHPEQYPFVEDIPRYYADYTLNINISVPYLFRLQGVDINPEESQKIKRELNRQLDEDFKKSVGEFLDTNRHQLDISAKNRIYVEFEVVCVNCGTHHIYGEKQNEKRIFLPLSYDLDYWKCNECGQLHSVRRRGMPARN
jgi:hypothetical protein